jgi:hypothetical protein
MKKSQEQVSPSSDELLPSKEMILALEKRLAELKADFHRCQSDLKVSEAQTIQRIEKDATKAVNDAADRMMKFQEFAKTSLTWVLGLILASVTVLGFGGFFGMKKIVEEFTLTEVKSWLQFNNESSPLREPLSRLTTRSIVDVLVMERARSDSRRPFIRDIGITSAWVDKLIADMINPSTSESDFSDLALALGTESSLVGGNEHQGRVLESIRAALLGDALTAHRKAILLRTFGFEIGLRDTAVTLFQKSKDAEVQGAAFQLLRRLFVPSAVVSLAKPILEANVASDDYANQRLQLLAAETLAKIDPNEVALQKWISALNNRGDSGILQKATIGLAALDAIPNPKSWVGSPMPAADKEKRLAFAVLHLTTAFERGAKITWRDEAAGRPIIGFKTDAGDFENIADPETLLTESLWSRLLTKFGRNTQGLVRLVTASTGQGESRESIGRLFRTELLLGKDDSVRTTNGEILTAAGLGNPIYLEKDVGTNDAILMRWRDLSGSYRTAYLKEATIQQAGVRLLPASAGLGNYVQNYSFNNLPR